MTENERTCSVCGSPGDTCTECLAMMSAAQTKKRQYRRENGLCLDCGIPASNPGPRCDFHYERRKAGKRKYHQRRSKGRRKTPVEV